MSERSAHELREGIRRGDFSARELTHEALDVAARQQDLGAFVEVQEELALRDADEADRRIAATPVGERHGLPPLIGLPTAHKDLVSVRGFATTHGSAAVPHVRADRDAPIAAAVRRAGAICIGKTQVPEFGIAGYSENLVARPARNPFDHARTAGGSSGGTGAAIAAGVIAAAIGSDAGGSIRIPSAACGLVGLKPGRGTLPADRAGGEFDEIGAPRMGVSGPMARTVRDAALFFDAVRGAPSGGHDDGHDGSASRAVHRAAEVRGQRIGISLDSPFESAMPIRFDDPAMQALGEAARKLEALGHHPEQAQIDYGNRYPDAFTTVWTQALTRIPLDADAELRLGELAQWFLERARSTSPAHLADCVAELHRFARHSAAQWGEYDVVLTPALASTAPAIGDFWRLGPEGDYRLQCEWAPQTSMVNVVGLPAITVPTSQDSYGMPRGVQLIGRRGSEDLLLQLAAQLLDE